MIVNGWLIKFFTTQDKLYDESAPVEEIEVPIKIINEITKTTKQVHLVGGCKGVSVSDKGVYSPQMPNKTNLISNLMNDRLSLSIYKV